MALDELPVAAEFLVEAAERRALVAGDHRPGHQAATEVGTVLVERKPDQALDPGEEDAALLEHVLVVQGDVVERPAAVAAVAIGAPETARRIPAWCGATANSDRHWLNQLTIGGTRNAIWLSVDDPAHRV